MKQLLTLLVLFFLSTQVYCQISAGLGLHYGTESDIGFSIRGAYNITENIRGNVTFNFLDKEEVSGQGFSAETSWRSLDIEGNYFFNGEISGPYAIAGPSLNFVKGSAGVFGISASSTATEIGLNIGGGYLYSVAESIDLFGEVKYLIISDLGQLGIQVGGLYRF